MQHVLAMMLLKNCFLLCYLSFLFFQMYLGMSFVFFQMYLGICVCISAICFVGFFLPLFLCLFIYICLYVSLYLCNHNVLEEAGTVNLREHLGFTWVFGGVHVAHLFSFLCCVFCFICLRPVSRVPNVASVSGLSILDSPFGFI